MIHPKDPREVLTVEHRSHRVEPESAVEDGQFRTAKLVDDIGVQRDPDMPLRTRRSDGLSQLVHVTRDH